MARSDKLKALREARAAGNSRNILGDEEENDIYDLVNEDEYREKRREDLLKDDFVIDDNGEGYIDNGADEWDGKNRHTYYSSDEEDRRATKKSQTKKKQKIQKSASAPINNFFKQTASVSSAPKKKLDTDFSDILDDFVVPKSKPSNLFSSAQTTPLFNSTNRFRNSSSGGLFNVSGTKHSSIIKKSSSVKKEINFDDDFEVPDVSYENLDSSPTRSKKSDNSGSIKISNAPVKTIDLKVKPEIKAQPLEEEAEEDDDDDDDVVVVKRQRVATINLNRDVNISSAARRIENSIKQQNEDVVESEQSFLLSSPVSSSIQSSPTKNIDQSIVLKDDKFKMFWLDYTEINNSLLLFGKTVTNDGQYVSTMVQVNGFNRELYFLPRDFRLIGGEISEEPVSAMDVHEEISPLIMDKFGLESLKAKPEVKKYAFEMPGIPKEKEYLKLLLPFQPPKNANIRLPPDLEGETFSHVFGTNATVFETFVTQRNIMGPCWLEIENGDFTTVSNSSHCKLEVLIKTPNNIKVIDKPTSEFQITPPSLTTCSISVQIMMNQSENKQEVVAVTLATYKDLPQDAPVDENIRPSELVTLARPVGASLPPGLKQIADKQGLPLRLFNNEKTMLNCLAALVKVADPDVFIGHRLENISLDILLHRMHDLKVSTFSTLGRRNRRQWPEKFGKSNNFNSSFLLREILSGRLLCDIANEMGQSLTPKCQSWDLTEMYEIVCKKKHHALEINLNNKQYQENANSFFLVLKENCSNALITAEVAFRIQILSLSKQLTNLAGNAWSHTLGGTRAGRNEFILLHEFTKNGYIIPDKETKQSRLQHQQHLQNLKQEQDGEGGESEQVSSNNKKSKYQGGLVFEPEKGLHKNYILVMDFNSLYPSIIQEFNICFTTVDRDLENIDELPDVPPTSIKQGVLPRLLSNLVNRRREVKKLLKDPTASAIEKAQYDIKQQALKLTANSMYGCLGYVNSRFYAKPLAMLVTNKGREILMDTRQLAESIGLRVVYGDTDSVMIDTGSDNFKEAIKIGEDFKLKVNERYRLLEIDIDNVFKRLLLHAKKKYAAMNASFDNQGNEITTLEVKGLDMKRREYCPLSKEVSTYVLEKLLSDLDPENALNEIYEFLENISNDIKEGKIRNDKFKINTKLSKDPSAYPGGKNMPAVQVALRLREQGKIIKAGSVITFVITAGDSNISVAERARSINEVMASNSEYKPDPVYYLDKQLFAPVERLVERIEGVDLVRLAKSLGLENYKLKVVNNLNNSMANILQPLESTISSSERFKASEQFKIKCKCGAYFAFGGIVASNDYLVTFNGIQCKRCSHTFSTLSISAQLENRIRSMISKYYQGYVKCDDSTCGIVTKHISVYGKKCLSNGCRGIMSYQYSDKELYNQLLYFDSLFDIDQNKSQTLKPLYDNDDKSKPDDLIQGQINALSEQNRELFEVWKSIVQKYLSNNGRRYVDMGNIFDFMKK
ncbi:hypothetical protein WICMUC_004258 [Wickerhamomyces mucosus]|uniref:DNA polymerase n=1 Tax=Wickerhamomyces mucosus TaxID=1378264 RepID=A0A9P8PHY3_9ASCO|nr:hypothetical protein WICMUC_004258 [Wickerhamomyces mucosus]